jgi:hypothetical protein
MLPSVTLPLSTAPVGDAAAFWFADHPHNRFDILVADPLRRC